MKKKNKKKTLGIKLYKKNIVAQNKFKTCTVQLTTQDCFEKLLLSRMFLQCTDLKHIVY